jgi:hypothetical protein
MTGDAQINERWPGELESTVIISARASELGNWRVDQVETRNQVACCVVFLQISAHSPKERYAILRSQVLWKYIRGAGAKWEEKESPSVHIYILIASLVCLTLFRPQWFFSHSCSKSSSALGRCAGSLWKHSFRNATSGSEKRSGIGGHSSSTIRNITNRFYIYHQRVSISTKIDEDFRTRHGMLAISPYGGRPVSNSMTVQPSDQMSDLVDAPLSSITSGAIQLGVPATSLFSPRSIARRLSETPKSVSFTFPVLVVRMFAALRSQCTTSLRWR